MGEHQPSHTGPLSKWVFSCSISVYEPFTRFYNKAYYYKKISNMTDCFCAGAWLRPHAPTHRESHNPLSPDTQTLQSNKEAAWQFWLQLSWAEPSHETHLTPDKSMDTTAHTNPLARQSTPINGNQQTWGASGSTVKTWACPPQLHGPHSLRSFYIIKITGPSTIKDWKGGGGTKTHTIQSNHVNTMKFQTKIILHSLQFPWRKFYNSSTRSTIWFLKVYPDTKLGI